MPRMRTRKGSWSLASAMPTTTRGPRHDQAGANSPPWPASHEEAWHGMAWLKTWLLGVGTAKNAWQPRWRWRSSPFQYQKTGSPTCTTIQSFIKSTFLFISQWVVSSALVVCSCAHCRKFNILVVPSSLHPNLKFFCTNQILNGYRIVFSTGKSSIIMLNLFY